MNEATSVELIASQKLAKQQLQSLQHTLPNNIISTELAFIRPSYSRFVEDLRKIVGSVKCLYLVFFFLEANIVENFFNF